jgi:hypothetical protein
MTSIRVTKLASVLFGLVFLAACEPKTVWAAKELTFVFRTTIDATPAGGAPDTPLTVTYTYDPDLRSQYDFDPVYGGIYTPFHMVIQLGDESVKATQGTYIYTWNLPDYEDGIDVRVENSGAYDGGRNVVNGTLFGYQVVFFRFLLADEDATMFDTAQLPLSPDYALEADFQQTELVLFNPATGEFTGIFVMEFPGQPPEFYTPFTLEDVTKKNP